MKVGGGGHNKRCSLISKLGFIISIIRHAYSIMIAFVQTPCISLDLLDACQLQLKREHQWHIPHSTLVQIIYRVGSPSTSRTTKLSFKTLMRMINCVILSMFQLCLIKRCVQIYTNKIIHLVINILKQQIWIPRSTLYWQRTT